MKILFATDLHGKPAKFQRVLEIAKKNQVTAVVMGGDNLEWDLAASGNPIQKQREFLTEFLDSHFSGYDEARIHWIGIQSSHDLCALDDDFHRLCESHPYVDSISRGGCSLDGFDFIGMDLVADYPLPAKSRCRRDERHSEPGLQMGPPVVPSESGWEALSDWDRALKAMPSLEEELEALPPATNPAKTVYVIHHPPTGLGLDVIRGGKEIGSDAVRRFLKRTQPRLSLHGHAHDSPTVSGAWSADLGRTLCVQPGQEGNLTYVLIDAITLACERFVE